jgi:dTDP-4-amino-4,6-dideoxygalactose transaminase
VEIDTERSDIRRADLFAALRAGGVGVNVHYIPIHTQPYYQRLGFRYGDFPQAEAYYAQAISLPLFPSMSVEQQDHVVQILRNALRA